MTWTRLAVVGAVLVSLMGARSAAGSWQYTALAAFAFAGLPVVLSKPKWAITTLFVLTGTFLPSRFGAFEVGGIRSDVPEVVLLALLGGWALHKGISKEAGPPRPAYAAVGLVAAAMVGAGIALGRGSTFGEVLGPIKTFFFWLLVLPVAWVLRSAEDLEWLERTVVVIAVAASALTLTMAALGIGVPTGEITGVRTLGVYSEATRFRPAALQLAFLATFLFAHRSFIRGWTRGRTSAMAVLLLAQVISFNRSTWVALAICLALYAVFRPGVRQPLRGISAALALVALLSLALLTAGSGILGSSAQAVALRARSVVTPSVLEEQSQQLRNHENSIAISAIRRNAVTGVGLNRPFGNRAAAFSHQAGIAVYSDTLLVHNTYLKLWLETGFAGIVALIALALGVWRVTRRQLRSLLPLLSSRSLAAALCLLGFAMQAVYQTKLYHRPTIVAAAAALALIAGAESLRHRVPPAPEPRAWAVRPAH